MTDGFDAEFWERHWRDARSDQALAPHPYLAVETVGLHPTTALEAGCGAGAEALWLAEHGWAVTAVDVSEGALSGARERAGRHQAGGRVRWVQADLETWEPDAAFDLVTTHYAHASGEQLDLYARIAGWVAPGGTLLVVGHGASTDDDAEAAAARRRGQAAHDHSTHDRSTHDRPTHDHPGHDQPTHDAFHDGEAQAASAHHHDLPPREASATADGVRAMLEGLGMVVVTAAEPVRRVRRGDGVMTLHDVVVRAVRPAAVG